VAGLLVLMMPGVALLTLGLIWPFASMLGISLYDKYPQRSAMTLAHYLEFLGDWYQLAIAWRTFALAFCVTLITAVIGYPVAWYLAWSNARFKHLLFLAVVFPLLVSIIPASSPSERRGAG
jgi:putative spermidine/putrescine transport system permease protein